MFTGFIADDENDGRIGMPLLFSLNEAFQVSDLLFFVFHGYTITLTKFDTKYYIFDSHSRDSKGCMTAEGKAVLMEFQTIDLLHQQLYVLFNSMALQRNILFEITPVHLNVINNECPLNENSILEYSEEIFAENILKRKRDNTNFESIIESKRPKLDDQSVLKTDCRKKKYMLSRLKYAENNEYRERKKINTKTYARTKYMNDGQYKDLKKDYMKKKSKKKYTENDKLREAMKTNAKKKYSENEKF